MAQGASSAYAPRTAPARRLGGSRAAPPRREVEPVVDGVDTVMRIMNENIHNGIRLLLFKVYYPDLTTEDKQRILRQTGDLYSRKDAQLKLMIEMIRNSVHR